MSNDTIHVQKHEDGWQLLREGGKRASAILPKKKEALQEAERYLDEKEDVKKLVIHKMDGSISRTKVAKKKKESKRSKKDKLKVSIYNTPELHLPYIAWKEVMQEDKPLTQKHVGCRVHVAGESSRTKSYLYAVHNPGDDMWPDGGYEVKWKGKDYLTSHFFDEVRLHKSERKQKKKNNV